MYQRDSYVCALDVKHLKKGLMNELPLLDICHFDYLLGNKSAVLFPQKNKIKSVKLRAKLTSEVLVCSAGSLAHDKTVCNPVTMTTHMWAPNKHVASTFSRKCRLLHIHRHRRNPTHKNTPSKRRAR